MGPSAAMPAPGWDSATIRVEPTGSVTVMTGISPHGQGQETTFAQIVAGELGIPAEDVLVEEGDTDNTPYGLGTYGSRSTPVGGAATAVVARKIRDKAKRIAAHLLEANPDDLEWTGVAYYDPPEMTYPFGAYIAVVDIDRGTGVVRVRRFIAVDDCGNRINPMIIEGQMHGGLAQGIGTALMEVIEFDDSGNHLNSSFMDYQIVTALEAPNFELGEFVTPSTHHPLGARGVAESPTVGSPSAIVNAVVDALSPWGVRHLDMPMTPARVWEILNANGIAE